MDSPVISIRFVPDFCEAKFGQSGLPFIFLSPYSKQLRSKIEKIIVLHFIFATGME